MRNKHPLFQKRHYEFIAKILGNDLFTMHEVNLFVGAFKRDNPKFNAELFITVVTSYQLGINDANKKHEG